MEKTSFRDRIAEHLKARPNKWVDGMTLAEIGGHYAWRSRVSDCRRDLNMTIENRQRVMHDHADDCPGLQAWDINEACTCGLPKRYVKSEYRYVPASLLEIAS